MKYILAVVLAGLAALVLATRVYVDADLVRVGLVTAPTAASAGIVRAESDGTSLAGKLKAPFAVTLRLSSTSPGSFSIAADGSTICARDVGAGSARRVDCVVSASWDPPATHHIDVRGPASTWSVDSLELSTHYGSNHEPNAFLILPAGSDHYDHPALVWVIETFVLLALAIIFLPGAPRMSRALTIAWRVLAAVALLELAVSLGSTWISPYRVVLSAQTFVTLLVLVFLPRLWSGVRVTATTPRGRVVAAGVLVIAAAMPLASYAGTPVSALRNAWARHEAHSSRARLLDELQPVALKNCDFKRFGEPNDGGYVLCANLLDSVASAYSYGVNGYDQWGCEVSRRLSVAVHEYDCFDLREPECPGGRAVFHAECVGPRTETIEGRLFDSPERQFEKNGDAGKRLVMKMDVEGAEWDTLAQASDATLQRIQQIAIELHGVDKPERNLVVIRRLKQFFYVASLHFNNFACQENIEPFPAWAYEALFVNKQIAVLDPSGHAGPPASELAANNPQWSDCQSITDLPQKK